MALEVGSRLGPYQVTAKIGEGRVDRGLIQRRDLLLTPPRGTGGALAGRSRFLSVNLTVSIIPLPAEVAR